jgi:tubulin polyglutamylase TTLL1
MNFEKRGWQRCAENEQWNIFWALPWTVKSIFNPDNGHRLNEYQLLNHYPNHLELTRKDLMIKNIKRFRKDMEKENNPIAERDDNGNLIHMDIVPLTYILPGDYVIFVEEFKRNPQATWIMKPTSSYQGKGIFLVNKLKQIQRWSTVAASKMPFQ